MCGIIGTIASHNIVDQLISGLERLEYRGYDSSGIATITPTNKQLVYHRSVGKVNNLIQTLDTNILTGNIGIAHNRWATHGKPSEYNAHPHCAHNEIAIVHNGIIENYLPFKAELLKQGIPFYSETDTEILPWLLRKALQTEKNLLQALHQTIQPLKGTFALLALIRALPDQLVAARRQSPLLIGLGENQNFLASDQLALLPFTQRFIYLQEGDVAFVSQKQITIYDDDRQERQRSIQNTRVSQYSFNKQHYTHYMQKEIKEQPAVLEAGIRSHLMHHAMPFESIKNSLSNIKNIHITACGSSYYAALVGRFWIEKLANIPCVVEVASEFIHRQLPISPYTVLILLSQSGETADTLSALREAKRHKQYQTIFAICNVEESSLAKEADVIIPIQAGIEIGVAATKSFLAQLNVLLLLAVALARYAKRSLTTCCDLIKNLPILPSLIRKTLTLENQIIEVAQQLKNQPHALLIARGIHYPIALEGALKLKEITYMHVEACAAGELKHGTLALLTSSLPIIILAPDDTQLSKLQSTIHEIMTRGGQLIIFAGSQLRIEASKQIQIIRLPFNLCEYFNPFLYTIPLQYLAYHIAHCKGLPIDQPRHLAKSVTVE